MGRSGKRRQVSRHAAVPTRDLARLRLAGAAVPARDLARLRPAGAAVPARDLARLRLAGETIPRQIGGRPTGPGRIS